MVTLNYLQLRIPVENAEIIFSALAEQYGIPEVDENGAPIDAETRAKKALIGVCDNAVLEQANRQALANVTTPELGIV